MPDSQSIEAEHGVQPGFSKIAPLAILVPPLCVLLFAWLLELTPNREELGPRHASIRFEPVQLDSQGFAPLRLAGAWKLTSDDPRFGGISALAIKPEGLLALGDSGVLIRFPPPAGAEAKALITELPAGPGSPGFKHHRDTEALAPDPSGKGWWVAFEVHHELWLYDREFDQALRRIRFGRDRWSYNSGIEALASAGGGLVAVPERERTSLRIRGGEAMEAPLKGRGGPVSGAVTLPGGDLLLLERRLGLRGFANSLVRLEPTNGGYAARDRIRLGLGPLDNAEALAVEPLAGGGLRLWVMTDDNQQLPFRTLLVALDMPAGGPFSR